MPGKVPSVIAVVPRVATAVLLLVACVGRDVAVVGVRPTLGTAAELLADLPCPFPCAVMLMQTATLAQDLPMRQVIVAVGAGATKVAPSPRQGRARPAAVAPQAAIPSAPRRQPLAHRGPAIHGTRRINGVVVLPVQPPVEAEEAGLVSPGGAAGGLPVVEGLTAPLAEEAAPPARVLLPLGEGAFPTGPITVDPAAPPPSPIGAP